MDVFGFDIGGSAIKAAPVDVEQGMLSGSRWEQPIPRPSTPEAVFGAMSGVLAEAAWRRAPVGCALPAVVHQGVAYSAANIDDSWIGVDAAKHLEELTGCPVYVLNDADAAGLAEMRFGAGKGEGGAAIMLTFGTGIGSAVFIDGRLYPNTELGHLELDGYDAETRAAARLRDDDHLTWDQWVERVNHFLAHVEKLFSPDLIIFGGGISESAASFFDNLATVARIVPARLGNDAGIVGAAVAAHEFLESSA